MIPDAVRANLKSYVDLVHSAISDELAGVSQVLTQVDEVWSGDASAAFRGSRDGMNRTASQLLGGGPGEGSLGQLTVAPSVD